MTTSICSSNPTLIWCLISALGFFPPPGGAVFPRPVVLRDVGPEDAASVGAAVPLPDARGQHAVPQQPGRFRPGAPRTQVRSWQKTHFRARPTPYSGTRGTVVASRSHFFLHFKQILYVWYFLTTTIALEQSVNPTGQCHGGSHGFSHSYGRCFCHGCNQGFGNGCMDLSHVVSHYLCIFL